jgi:hypothetical protein
MDDKELAGIAQQQLLCGLSDSPEQWRDPMAPFRDLMAAQRRALDGDDDGFSALTVPF